MQNNNFLWSSDSLNIALNDFLLAKITNHILATEIFLDSRKIVVDGIFLAISGQNFDGHNFVESALNNGAKVAIVSDTTNLTHLDASRLVVVTNTMQALSALAAYKRKQTTAKIIAITGSIGKTSTKEMLQLSLNSVGKTYFSKGNFNNHIGLPLSLANMPNDCDYAIFEMGMNHANEIKPLSQLAKPDIVIITTIKPVHIEFFNNEQEIALAKAEIFAGLNKNFGQVLINKNNLHYQFLYEQALQYGISPAHIFSFSDDLSVEADYTITNAKINNINSCQIVAKHQKHSFNYQLNSINQSIISNSIIIVACLHLLKINLDLALKTLETFSNSAGRGKLITLSCLQKELFVLDDTYNASTASMKSGILDAKNYQQILQNDRLILILGDMLELGEKSLELHQEVLDFALQQKPDLLILVGKNFTKSIANYVAKLQNTNLIVYSNSNLIACSIFGLLQNKDFIYIKGSRGIKMENIINYLTSLC